MPFMIVHGMSLADTFPGGHPDGDSEWSSQEAVAPGDVMIRDVAPGEFTGGFWAPLRDSLARKGKPVVVVAKCPSTLRSRHLAFLDRRASRRNPTYHLVTLSEVRGEAAANVAPMKLAALRSMFRSMFAANAKVVAKC